MKATHIDLAADLVIIGLPLRTSRERAAEDIPGHWKRFLSDAPMAQLVRESDGSVYAVYCDYESDFSGPYTMLLGAAAEPVTPVPTGLRRVRVPRGSYASFHAAGDPARVIWQTWSYVNTEWEGRPRRRYIADYERYAPGTGSTDTVEADIVVGLT